MTRFLQGIGATLLVIVIAFYTYYTYQDIKSGIAFDKTHYSMKIKCWNCVNHTLCIIDKGIEAVGTEHLCKKCGMIVKIL